MSNISSTSYCKDNSCEKSSPILMFLLLMLCTGDNGLFGCGSGGSSCGLGGIEGIMPILLILCLCGGSLF